MIDEVRGRFRAGTGDRSRRLWALFMAASLIWAGGTGCGKKGPPVPPRQLVLKAVDDLTAADTNCTVTLRWSIPRGGDNILLTGFVISRGRQDPEAAGCDNCPPGFKRVAELYISDLSAADRKNNRAVYTENPPCGYRYVYRVAGFTGKKVVAPDSNVVAVDLSRETPKR